ncbi:DUF7219 family protein [Leptolyngbya sp. AN02str]|uniref:DUF7219 family protein n=1 Tax=Leptolyngbya sp. AN02str TaxID=3423363 RepID=UPI003D3121AF
MSNQPPSDKDRFIYPKAKYQGDFTPEKLAFDANLQEFAQRVAMLCSLETGGKLEPEAAYREIKEMWRKLKKSKAQLLDTERPNPPDLPAE